MLDIEIKTMTLEALIDSQEYTISNMKILMERFKSLPQADPFDTIAINMTVAVTVEQIQQMEDQCAGYKVEIEEMSRG